MRVSVPSVPDSTTLVPVAVVNVRFVAVTWVDVTLPAVTPVAVSAQAVITDTPRDPPEAVVNTTEPRVL